MKTKVSKLTDLQFAVSAVNKAVVTAKGEVPTLGWTSPELGNDRMGDGILHTDFLAQSPEGATGQAISPIEIQRSFSLGPQAREITVHSETNEMSITLPSAGDSA
jgi:hypothetical protein